MRLAFVVLTLAGGAGIVLYAAGWLFLPTDDGAGRDVARNDLVQVLALGAVTLGVLLLAQSLGLGFSDALLWPIVLAAMGSALIVGRSGRPIDELIGELVRRDRGPVRHDTTTPETASVLRVVVGGALVVAGVGRVPGHAGRVPGRRTGPPGGGGDPRWSRAGVRSLALATVDRARRGAERAHPLRRARRDGGAPARLGAPDPGPHPAPGRRSRAVVGLARSQERELRAWLFGRAPRRADLDLGDALEATAADVEQRQGVPIEIVRVGGDCPLDDRLRALVAATQEAIVNAARHSGAPLVAVYEEVETDQVTVFVRDRGRGFDPASIPTDRGGIAESITGRMQRNGGVAVIRSRPGQGTEVELSMKRVPA